MRGPAELLRRLHDLEDAPWGEWYGSPISGRGLAKLLGPYRVIPMQRRVQRKKSRGYVRSEFEDAWTRYLPPLECGTSGTSGMARPDDAWPVPDVPDVPVPQTPMDLWSDPVSVADPEEQTWRP